jgi:hypothetical protein
MRVDQDKQSDSRKFLGLSSVSRRKYRQGACVAFAHDDLLIDRYADLMRKQIRFDVLVSYQITHIGLHTPITLQESDSVPD